VGERAARERWVGEHKGGLRGQIIGGDGPLQANSHVLSLKKRLAFITTFAKLPIIHQLASPSLGK